MPNITQDQLMGLLRQLLPVLGGLALAFGVSQATVNYWINVIFQIAGPLSIIAGIVWSLIANNKTSILTAAANLPEVKEITLDKKSEEAPALEAATPANVVQK